MPTSKPSSESKGQQIDTVGRMISSDDLPSLKIGMRGMYPGSPSLLGGRPLLVGERGAELWHDQRLLNGGFIHSGQAFGQQPGIFLRSALLVGGVEQEHGLRIFRVF